MQTVIISGRPETAMAVYSACSRYGGAVLCHNGRVYSTHKRPKYLLVGASELKEPAPAGSIVVLDGGKDKLPLGSCITVIDSGNVSSVSRAADSGAVTVGCSASGRDTLTISGVISEGNALVSLGRRLKSVNGDSIEPCEIRVVTRDIYGCYPTLAASAVLLLSGEKGEDGFAF